MRRATAAERRHLAAVATLGCVICRRPAQVHHVKLEPGQRRDHWLTIGLCREHHDELHAGRQSFASRYGSERELLERVREELGVAA